MRICTSGSLVRFHGGVLSLPYSRKSNRVMFSPTASWRRVRGAEIELCWFFTSDLVGGGWLSSRPGRFTLRRNTLVPIKEYVGPETLFQWDQKFTSSANRTLYAAGNRTWVCGGLLRRWWCSYFRVSVTAGDCKGTTILDAKRGSADKTNGCHAVADWRCWFYLWIPVDAGSQSISPLRWQATDHHFKTLLLVSRFTLQIIACCGIHLWLALAISSAV